MRAPRSPGRRYRPLLLAIGVLIAAGACSAAARPEPSASATAPPTISLAGRLTAGPVCPVERVPPDPACAPRPVAGATLIANDTAGREAARAVSGTDGRFVLGLVAGRYTITAEPVQGLMGAPRPVVVTLTAGVRPAPLELQYDTGIR